LPMFLKTFLKFIPESRVSTRPLIQQTTLVVLMFGVCVITVINVPFALHLIEKSDVYQYFKLSSDYNIPAWYSSMILAIAGLLSFECYSVARNKSLSGNRILLFFGLLLFLMSCDEIARFHEVLPEELAHDLQLPENSMVKYHPWVTLGGPFIAALFLFFIYSLRQLLKQVPGSFPLMVSGLVLMFLGGVVLETAITYFEPSLYPRLWQLELMVEENMEMIGSLLICSSLVHWRDHTLNGIEKVAY